jgi:hypothetical protein
MDRVDNAFFVSETILEAQKEDQAFFGGQDLNDDKNDLQSRWTITDTQPDTTSSQQKLELVYVLISPSLVHNNDFVYVIEDFYRAKFTVCAIQKRSLNRQDLQAHFKDCLPRTHNIEHLE